MLHVGKLRLGLEWVLSRGPPRLELRRCCIAHRAHQLDVVRVDLHRTNRDEVLVIEYDRGERELALHGLVVALRRIGFGGGCGGFEPAFAEPRKSLADADLITEGS